MSTTALSVHAVSTRFMAALIVLAVMMLTMAVALPVAAVPIPGGVGFRDFAFGAALDDPTEDKPQSKVWYNDGFWWGGLWNPTDAEHQIYKLVGENWMTTGVALDDRSRSHADYLWDGTALYVASVSGDSQAEPILVFRYTYDAGTDTYALDPAFVEDHDGDPTLEEGRIAGQGPSESVTIAKDGTNQLWITYTADTSLTTRSVMINSSQAAGQHAWGTPFALATAPVITDDDISAIVQFGTSIGVMWTNQSGTGPEESSFGFSVHADSGIDTAWAAAENAASNADVDFVDDHLSLRALGDGTILAAVKTNAGPDHIQLLVRASGGGWSPRVVVGEGIDATRPQVVVDSSNNQAFVLYTIPVLAGDPGDQAIFYKAAPLTTLAFGTGNGTAFISEAAVDINDVSTSKHSVTATSGLLGVAASETNDTYYHGFVSLGVAPPGLPFDDIAGSQFVNDIVWIADRGITTGCSTNPPLYCPGNNVTREQMASFLVRALLLPATANDYFVDDETSIHEADINALAESGVTTGCAAFQYCPTNPVTRGQMAAFLHRAVGD